MQSDFAKREEEILERWKKADIFGRSLSQNKDKEPFVYYDGPPFATGLPHFGHLLPTSLKDAVPRYQTMRGRYVPRQWGWDCHGLPIENLIQKELSLPMKTDIEAYGIGKFSAAAAASVSRFDAEWRKIIPRAGRWVDMDQPYLTMDPNFIESGWWAFKTLFDKDLIYEGFQVVHVSPLLETSLSNMESAQNYKDITDISVYAKFKIRGADAGLEKDASLIAWTTTPWTLPGNVALAVHPELSYVALSDSAHDAEVYVVAESRVEALCKLVPTLSVVSGWKKKGSELVGLSYQPLFPYYAADESLANRENGWKVYVADFVTDDSGTGIVHIAPAFGEEDLHLAKRISLPFVQHVRIDGSIKEELKELAGLQAKPKEDPTATDVVVIKYLAHNGLLLAKEKIVHSYPHCPRTDAPLLNYAMSAWFIAVSQYRDRMVELNKGVRWVPEEIGSGRFGKWIENARDWGVSRPRYWGSPLPIWKSEDGSSVEVIGSLDELMQKKGTTNRFWMMRHAQSQGNVTDVVSALAGTGDGLTEEGKKQAVAAAAELANAGITRIYTSDLDRARETAQIVRETLGLSESALIIDTRLRELQAGDFQDRSWADLHAYIDSLPEDERYTKAFAGGESYQDAKRRSMEFLFDTDASLTGEGILIVTHGVVMSSMVLGSVPLQENRIWKEKVALPSFPNASVHQLDFVQFPHNAKFELDLHRPYVDAITWQNAAGQTMRRIPDVFDTWYDSGSVPFAKWHYPFENKEAFEKKGSMLFPADYIAEGQDQTRGWFYSMLALNTPLFDTVPYKNVIVNGMVLAEDGQKMSKSKNNFPPVLDSIGEYSADALRYFLLSSPVVKAEDVAFSVKGVDEVQKKIVGRMRNVVTFYETYADMVSGDTDGVPASSNVLDAWMIALLVRLRDEVTTAMDEYRMDKATRPFSQFVDDLSTWYVRRSRDRYKDDAEASDKEAATATLRYVLIEFSKLLAPFMPFLAEDIYLRVAKAGENDSVHLLSWPEYKKDDSHATVLAAMEQVRAAVSVGLEVRAKAGVKVRQPLASVTVPKSYDALSDATFVDIAKEELNVKELIVDEKADSVSLDLTLTDELRKEGLVRDFIRAIQSARKTAGMVPADTVVVTAHVPNDALWNDLESSFDEVCKATRASTIARTQEPQSIEAMIGSDACTVSVERADVSRS
jgi:isoleucyl-tRNA synthetase